MHPLQVLVISLDDYIYQLAWLRLLTLASLVSILAYRPALTALSETL